ncbi:uncharacterized protein LOC123554182 [Mercenaria mercenaria]|uniref:uncharacterized protein LOC123554182 n=1 Tax=Mercenaria mercenaria TaxID=6596 RepID=UPI00234F1678|nr:uncharacterized protein LOC123554182 [Mercenaria mercenaria]XP_053404333.1 uncharacterized protein LOC123554182 [Mercenaria mercenaria]
MSREASSTKKRRLESEQSQTSEITLHSNATQNTELSSDLDDNNSDSSSTNLNNTFYGSRSNVTNDVQTQMLYSRERRARRAIRKRQVSWSLDDDETFVKEIPQRPIAQYDNNFTGTNNSRRRTRRATESSLDNHALSYFQPQSPVNGQCDSFNHQPGVPPLRSNTTSQIHGHENEIQKQRIKEELIRQHDARTLQQTRSRSVTSLRTEGTQIPLGSHMYESLQQQRTAPVINNRPVETVVTMPHPDRYYLHPKTETKIQRNMKSGSFTTLNNIPGFSGDESSAYADVVRYSEGSTVSQHQVCCFNDCNSSFYRKGFFVLVVLNVILVILNSFGLPFVYSAINQEGKEEANHEGITGAQMSEICLKCEMLIGNAKQELESSEVTITEDKQCCFKSAEQLLPALLSVS